MEGPSIQEDLVPTGCLHAARQFYEECYKWPECGCGIPKPEAEKTPVEPVVSPAENSSDEETIKEPYQKDNNEVIDPKSTGRKRAAKLFPLNRENSCEWQGQKFQIEGHGYFVGCSTGKQQAIHHGPNKDTLVNVEGNVWRICTVCHNRYHTIIDPTYDWNKPADEFETITLEPATLEEQGASEIYWMNRKVKAGERSINPND